MLVEKMGSIGHSDELSDGNKEQVFGNWRKRNPCYMVS